MARLLPTVMSRWKRPGVAAADFISNAKLILGSSSGCASIILAAFTAGTLWLGAWYMADQDASRTRAAAYNDTANLARAFEENVIRLIQAYDQILLFARSSYTTDPQGFDLIKWAHEQHFVTDAALQLVIIGKSGYLKATTMGMPKTPMYLGDRKHFRIHVTDARDFLYISTPVLGRLSRKWSIQISRRIYGPDGSFAGVILVAIDPAYLETFFSSIDTKKESMVLLAGLDGVVRARASAHDRSVGQSILSGTLFQHYLPHTDAGSFVTQGKLDGTRRFASYRKVRGYPLVVMVGIARSAALAMVRYHRNLYFGTAALMSALILLLTTMIVRRQIGLHRATAKLADAADFDYLTRIPNRRRFHEDVSRLIASRDGVESQFALLLIDLDNFKVVNDTLGHEAGDLVLCETARRLQAIARPSDLIARLGGDEFALLRPDSTRCDGAALADEVLCKLRRKMQYREQSIETYVSVGVAFFPADGSSWSEIFRAADLALYQAKNSGRNRSTAFLPRMMTEIERRFEVLRSVRAAVEQDRIVPYYQPQVCTRSGAIVGFEALARIVADDGRICMPREFLSALEDAEVGRGFGQRMIEAVCRDLQHCAENEIHIPRIAINVAALELRGEDYADRVIAALRADKLSPDSLEIEITESVALDGNNATIAANLKRLREYGLTISLDDFGTGYASLTHLQSLPIGSVKIDRTFIARMVEDRESLAIVRATIRLSHNLGKTVVAEGVEEEAQLNILRDLKCDAVQGYLLSEPLPFAELPSTMLQHLVRSNSRRHLPGWRRFADGSTY